MLTSLLFLLAGMLIAATLFQAYQNLKLQRHTMQLQKDLTDACDVVNRAASVNQVFDERIAKLENRITPLEMRRQGQSPRVWQRGAGDEL